MRGGQGKREVGDEGREGEVRGYEEGEEGWEEGEGRKKGREGKEKTSPLREGRRETRGWEGEVRGWEGRSLPPVDPLNNKQKINNPKSTFLPMFKGSFFCASNLTSNAIDVHVLWDCFYTPASFNA